MIKEIPAGIEWCRTGGKTHTVVIRRETEYQPEPMYLAYVQQQASLQAHIALARQAAACGDPRYRGALGGLGNLGAGLFW